MPAAVATLICSEIRSKQVRRTIGLVSAPHQCFSQVQVVVGAAQWSCPFQLCRVNPCGELSPPFARRFFIDGNALCARGANGERGCGLFVTCETVAPAEELSRRFFKQLDAALQWVRDGKYQVVIDRKFPLAETRAAQRFLEGRDHFGKIVLIP